MHRIALFGGTFDPVHNGHIVMANGLATQLNLDRVILMPTFVPPHKLKPDIAPAIDRLAMCRLAFEPYPLLTVSDMEINRRGASFTVVTLQELKKCYPTAELFLLVGSDMFLTLGTWCRFADIARLATICTVSRNGLPQQVLRDYAASLEKEGAHCLISDLKVPSVSSTDIRARLAARQSVADLVPESVAAYLAEHHLYTENKTYLDADEQYKDIIRGRLTPRRFEHSLAVAAQAEHLAKKYGADPAKAKTSGILHDILKDTDRDSQLQIFRDFGILLDAVEQKAPKLWHAHAGEVFIENILGVKDREILDAVRYHTTGRAEMTLLDTILYLADFTSADRDYDDVDVMRELTENDLDEAMKYALEYTISELEKGHQQVHPDTQACYRELLERMKKGHG